MYSPCSSAFLVKLNSSVLLGNIFFQVGKTWRALEICAVFSCTFCGFGQWLNYFTTLLSLLVNWGDHGLSLESLVLQKAHSQVENSLLSPKCFAGSNFKITNATKENVNAWQLLSSGYARIVDFFFFLIRKSIDVNWHSVHVLGKNIYVWIIQT